MYLLSLPLHAIFCPPPLHTLHPFLLLSFPRLSQLPILYPVPDIMPYLPFHCSHIIIAFFSLPSPSSMLITSDEQNHVKASSFLSLSLFFSLDRLFSTQKDF